MSFAQTQTENLAALLKKYSDNPEKIREIAEEYRIEDIAEALEELDEDTQIKVASALPTEDIAELLSEIDEEESEDLIKNLDAMLLVDAVHEMSPDEIAELVRELDPETASLLLSKVENDKREDVCKLLNFPPDSAGSLMTPEIVVIPDHLTVAEALPIVKKQLEHAKIEDRIFIVDKAGRPVGVISLAELILADLTEKVSKLVEDKPIVVKATDDREVAANLALKYELRVVPVVDDTGKLIGAIPFDEILYTVEEETEEDMLKMVGASDPEEESPIKASLARLPWLIVNLFGGLLAGNVIKLFQNVLSKSIALAFFVPVITGMGGNAALQTATTVVRGLATGEVKLSEIWETLFKEVVVAFFVGAGCALIAGSAALIMQGEIKITLIVGTAMFTAISIAAIVGTVLPMFFEKVGVDPAIATGPFVTTSNDIIGIFIYFTVAKILL